MPQERNASAKPTHVPVPPQDSDHKIPSQLCPQDEPPDQAMRRSDGPMAFTKGAGAVERFVSKNHHHTIARSMYVAARRQSCNSAPHDRLSDMLVFDQHPKRVSRLRPQLRRRVFVVVPGNIDVTGGPRICHIDLTAHRRRDRTSLTFGSTSVRSSSSQSSHLTFAGSIVLRMCSIA